MICVLTRSCNRHLIAGLRKAADQAARKRKLHRPLARAEKYSFTHRATPRATGLQETPSHQRSPLHGQHLAKQETYNVSPVTTNARRCQESKTLIAARCIGSLNHTGDKKRDDRRTCDRAQRKTSSSEPT